MSRKRLFDILETSKEDDTVSSAYDFGMMIIIIISLIPLAFKEETQLFRVIDKSAAIVFSIDYIMRWGTADYKLGKDKWSFVWYPFTIMAIIDLICILPSLSIIANSFRILKVIRLLRTIRVLRVFKAVRYSRSIHLIGTVFRTQKKPLIAVGILALSYVLISALVVFNIEPDTFDSYYEAVYWATVSLTTMGYGDIYPVSSVGRFFTMVSSIFGIAIIALPSGIITAGFLDALREEEANNNQK